MDKLEQLDQLKSFAAKRCIEIFDLFDEIEIQEQLAPIRCAWDVGKGLSVLFGYKNSGR